MRRKFLLAALLALAAATASAKEPTQSACAGSFGLGRPVIAKPAGKAHLLCYRAYATLTSELTRTPLWSAEFLTRDAVNAARDVPRDSDFFEEDALPAEARARLADYGRGAGYDRGHMAPSGDFADKASQAESFSLANVIPQNPTSNRRTWSHIETSTRKLVRQIGAAYVVTGPAFIRNAGMLRGRIRIPDFVWKAIYVPGKGAAAYIVRNDETPAYSEASIAELAHLTGVDPFPSLPPGQRGTAIDLPPPTPHPGEKPARRVTLAWLTSAEAAKAQSASHLVQSAGTLLSLALAYAR
ncbi:DNA/RNA non-specific endonuclease [Cupriavidus basilensis]|uniref:DNA/RNA non-specific endonuclease n=1 Tax=Cupriavidus basilensis TaxID=68895 RepID=UPI0007512497|nr:DNA/RNA non-specific endonuclease [Cupriavidus basilensis]